MVGDGGSRWRFAIFYRIDRMFGFLSNNSPIMATRQLEWLITLHRHQFIGCVVTWTTMLLRTQTSEWCYSIHLVVFMLVNSGSHEYQQPAKRSGTSHWKGISSKQWDDHVCFLIDWFDNYLLIVNGQKWSIMVNIIDNSLVAGARLAPESILCFWECWLLIVECLTCQEMLQCILGIKFPCI